MAVKNVIIVFMCVFLSQMSQAQSKAIERSGDIIQYMLPALSIASAVQFKDGQKPGMQWLKGFGTAMTATHLLKFIIDKERPNGGSYSFPSGHTAAAFSGAAFLHRRHGWAIGIPSYTLAAYVGWTRIDANKHDVVDVISGALIGWGSTYFFARPYLKDKVNLTLVYYNDFLTIGGVLRF